MKVSVLASGSKGNSTYIECNNTKILVDIGMPSSYIIQKLAEINVSPKEIDAIIRDHGNQATMIRIEPKASGYSFIQLIETERTYNVSRITGRLVQDGKMARVKYAAPKVESSRVWLMRGNWNDEFITQLTAFPNYAHDEYPDLLGYAVKHYFG